jgi:hypothetical protein
LNLCACPVAADRQRDRRGAFASSSLASLLQAAIGSAKRQGKGSQNGAHRQILKPVT